MKTIELKGFVHCRPADKYDEPDHVRDGLKYSFWEFEKMGNGSGFALVAPHTLAFEVPDSFNPSGQFVEALEAEKKKVMAAFQNRITEIDRQISQFLAIESS